MGIDKNKRPILADDYASIRITTSTAASTALAPRGVIALTSTSTAGTVVYTLASAPKRGHRFSIGALLVSATSAQFNVNAASGSFLGSSSEDMLQLSTAGNGATFVGVSTTRWLCVGNNGGTFSTST